MRVYLVVREQAAVVVVGCEQAVYSVVVAGCVCWLVVDVAWWLPRIC